MINNLENSKMIEKSRPVNLYLNFIDFNVMMIASVLHRISGFFLFLFCPFIFYCFHLLAKDKVFFLYVTQILFFYTYFKMLICIFSIFFIHHLLFGIRHLLMDFIFPNTIKVGRITIYFMIVIECLLLCAVGVLIW
ncbi:succinate dehydrogenase, cytochrome b556 subunit [Candidatus Legionella polyplacis]|uniref:succinate dehydrogenase, cytochrome b556 subunit n=1 Tax=Candidatus Legionella polyplacis TaxID=2005262 RepID=UPI000C1DE343|nr:succinate dehydrogenase, cytochrome b556 subunit [Candidatus Legionella polyplacis]ATW01907.1 succinate dehydrogenase, cytochrome b556 subunit [Candidatus Legionella polyplacis]